MVPVCHPDEAHFGRGLCRKCYQRWWYGKNREKVAGYQSKFYSDNPDSRRNWALISKYGITQKDYEVLVDAQGNICALCGCSLDGSIPQIDHDHETGMIRAILCRACNTRLGLFQDDVRFLEQAIIYLSEFKQ